MLEKNAILQFLKVNGLPAEASDEEVKALLIKARWHEKDVAEALTLLRANPETSESNTQERAYIHGDKLRPETISALLSIDVEVVGSKLGKTAPQRSVYSAWHAVCIIAIFAVLLAVATLVVAMWYFDMGFFHNSGLGF